MPASSKRTLDHTELAAEDRDDVEAHIAGTADVPVEVLRGEPAQAKLLDAGDRLGRHARRSLRRVLTSQKTTTSPRAQTRSTSPALLRQLRSTIW